MGTLATYAVFPGRHAARRIIAFRCGRMRQVVTLILVLVAVTLVGLAAPNVAVAPFVDKAGTGLANLGPGLGEMLAQRLSAGGLFVVPPGALQAWLTQNGLLPTRDAWQAAARAFGAEVLILPAVEVFQATTMSFTLFLFTVRGATVQTDLSAEVVTLATGAIQAVAARGEASGPASVEVTLYFPFDVCLGGFRTGKSVYLSGESVRLGYRDIAPPSSFYVVVHQVASPVPNWTSTVAASTVAAPCVTWTWNQMFGATPAPPGDYVADLYRIPSPIPIATRTFTISAAAAVELVVGSPAFGTAPWGEALAQALDDLTAKLVALLLPSGGG